MAIDEYQNSQIPSWSHEIERNSLSERLNQTVNVPCRQGYPFTVVSNSTRSQPATPKRNPLLNPKSETSTISSSRNLNSHANLSGSQSHTRHKSVPSPSSSAHKGNSSFSLARISGDEPDPRPEEHPHYGVHNLFSTRHKVTEPAAEVNQIDRLNDLDDLHVVGVEQPETAWKIEGIKPKDGEVELSDVEDESKASKGFSK